MTPDKLAQLEASLVDEHIAMLQEARRERDHHKQNASDLAKALSKEQAINADLLAALKPIVDCYGLGLSPEKFCEHVGPFILEARELLHTKE